MKNLELLKKKLKKNKLIKWISIPGAIAIIGITFFILKTINPLLKDFAAFLAILIITVEIIVFGFFNKKSNELKQQIYDVGTKIQAIEDTKNI